MSLSADFIYDGVEYDVSNRVVFNYFSEFHPDREEPSIVECKVTLEQLLGLHKILCDTLYKEQMDLDLEHSTVWEEAISPVKGAIKAMRQNPDLVVWYNGGY